jgi:formate hydrogenlyase subunit 3/multisubunit Na+/H+ antiporter MnhD subunit
MIFGILRVIVGRLNNLNQKKIKKILGLSSIFSLGWVMLSIFQRKVWLFFMLGYGLILWTLLISLRRLKLVSIDYLDNSGFSVVFYLIFFLGLLIIRGIPPFLMFYLKILILLELVHVSTHVVFILLVLSVFMIYIYLIIGFRFLSFLKNRTFFSKSLFSYNIYFINYLLYNFLFILIILIFL